MGWFRVSLFVRCPVCNGIRYSHTSSYKLCPRCHGHGVVLHPKLRSDFNSKIKEGDG